jgi:phosphatidate cytidylyltransferase
MARFENLLSRVLVAVIAIPLILFFTLKGGYYFFIMIACISSLALYEFYGLAEKKGIFPLKVFGMIVGVLMNGAFFYERLLVDIYSFFASHGFRLSVFAESQLFAVILIVFLLVILLVELFSQKGSPMLNASVTMFGVLVISLCFGTLIFTRELFPNGFPIHNYFTIGFADEDQLAQINRWGGMTIIGVLASIWMCDTFAYFGGKTFGRHLLFKRVSPKKTWEGTIIGFAASVLTMIIVKILFLEYLLMIHAVILGMLIGSAGQLGDLIESRFKRDADVKDSSSILPGHGGIYDRFDSLIFISPIVYLYMQFIVLS